MRDPGQPGRNPWFDDERGGSDAPRERERAGHDGHGEWSREESAQGERTGHQGWTPDLTGLAALAAALQEAGPEAGEHLVNAAHELVLAVKVIVDATESVLADQREAFAAARSAREEPVVREHPAPSDDDTTERGHAPAAPHLRPVGAT